MFEKLFEKEILQGLLPLSEQRICNRPTTSGLTARECGTTSSTKEESKGTLMPLLFRFDLYAFFDDIYVLWQPHQTREVHNILAEKLFARADPVTHGQDKDVEQSCDLSSQDGGPWDVWNPEGIKILGTSVGSDVFEEFSRVCVHEETKLWEALGWVTDVQCAWQILLQCAGLRCHHFLRTVFAQSATHANSHDVGMWTVLRQCLGAPRKRATEGHGKMSRNIANAPRRPRRRRSTIVNWDGACWAFWADVPLRWVRRFWKP